MKKISLFSTLLISGFALENPEVAGSTLTAQAEDFETNFMEVIDILSLHDDEQFGKNKIKRK